MIPFLKSVAKAYAARYSDLSDFCFLFPNKRSGTFFLKYLQEENSRHLVIAPRIKAISEFVSDLSRRAVASRLNLLFLLYESYLDLLKPGAEESGAVDFDSFRNWGEIVLSDFNDVDLHLADPDEIFKNVKDFREITSNFLSDEQKKVMEEYFGHSDFSDPTTFWRNFEGEEENLSESKKKFLHLWRIMGPLYHRLAERLAEENLATTGGAYREAYRRLCETPRGGLKYEKVVAIGFNALSASERGIFERLRDAEPMPGHSTYADFFWDATGPVLSAEGNSASKFVRSNIRSFPCPPWALNTLRLSDTDSLPERLDIIASPSNSAQPKIAGELLSGLKKRLDSSEFSGARVAVVLPDESLLLPMLYSLPENIGDVNLTMGYSLRMTTLVPFISYLRSLFYNQRMSRGEKMFYNKDLRTFLCHPFSRVLSGGEASGELIKSLAADRSALVPLGKIREHSPVLADCLGRFHDDMAPVEVTALVDDILCRLLEALKGRKKRLSHQTLEISNIERYRDSIGRLSSLLRRYSVGMSPMTVFRLLDRLIGQEKVGFEGEPLSGLQIMGTLETRSIDFDHLIILSVNERILPMRHRTRTFIPDTLRRAYGIPPSNYAESIFSYYFYRMISRAKEVSIIYDARTSGGGKSGGMSRYLLQLQHLFADGKADWKSWKFRLAPKKDYDPTVFKTEEILKWIQPYTVRDSGRNFSASSLNTYRECQVRFFYRHVLNIDTDPEPSEFIDAIKAGNIVHQMLLDLYLPAELQRRLLENPVVMTKERISELLSDQDALWKRLTRTVNHQHYGYRGEELDTPLSGASEMVATTLLDQIINVLRHDLSIAPFRIFGGEISKKIQVGLNSGRMVNFNFAIDRLDEIDTPEGPRLRIVDYKTGKTKLEAETVDSLFESGYRQEQIFQLYTYAWLLNAQKFPGLADNPLVEIYNVADIHKEGTHIPSFGKESTAEYKINEEVFDKGINEMIESIFENKEFVATEDKDACHLCSLRTICRR